MYGLFTAARGRQKFSRMRQSVKEYLVGVQQASAAERWGREGGEGRVGARVVDKADDKHIQPLHVCRRNVTPHYR